MDANPNQVIITLKNPMESPWIRMLSAFHRHYPEVCAEGATSKDAAVQLAFRLETVFGYDDGDDGPIG